MSQPVPPRLSPAPQPDPAHTASLGRMRTKRDQIHYALEHLPRGAAIAEIQSWLRAQGCEPPVRTYATPVVNEWRARQGLADTGGTPQLTPELLAQLDTLNTRPPAGPSRPEEPAAARTIVTSPVDPGSIDPGPVDRRSIDRSSVDHPSVDVSPVDLSPAEVRPLEISPDVDEPQARPAAAATAEPPNSTAAEPPNSAVKALRWVAAARRELDTTRGPKPEVAATGTAGRLWAWLAFLLGAGFSVLANVVQTMHPTPTHLQQWLAAHPGQSAADYTPDPVAVAFGVFWPLAVLLAVELLTRVRWQPGFLFSVVRYGGTLVVAAVAGVVSYGHMRDLFITWGQDTLTAYAGPIAVDGLMLVAAAALLSIAKGKRAE